jgi:hypothetical protein
MAGHEGDPAWQRPGYIAISYWTVAVRPQKVIGNARVKSFTPSTGYAVGGNPNGLRLLRAQRYRVAAHQSPCAWGLANGEGLHLRQLKNWHAWRAIENTP